jgi:hypothetical protein
MKLKYLFNRSVSGQRTRSRLARIIRDTFTGVCELVTIAAVFGLAILAIVIF